MKRPVLSLIAISMFATLAFADGPPHDEHNRYTGGEVIIINLTDNQKRTLDAPNVEFGFLLTLTKQQSEMIKSKWGVAPTKLEIWETRKGLWDCSCMSANLGLRFSQNQVEVPRRYIMADEEAENKRTPAE